MRSRPPDRSIVTTSAVARVSVRGEASAVAAKSVYCRSCCSAVMRASMGGWVENRVMTLGLSLIPDAWMDVGSSPGSTRPKVASALIMLFG